MGDHPHAAAYRAAFAAFNAGDADAFAAHLADDVVWHAIDGETMNGSAAVAESMSGLANLDFNVELHDVVANGNHVIALVTANVGAGGNSITYRTAEIMHVDDDGKVTERWAFADDSAAVSAFFDSLG
jgi:ketosteroid isomerase-like protein